MRRFINKLTGGEMWVADDRVKEYLEAGHRPASFTGKLKEEPQEDGKAEEPVVMKISKDKSELKKTTVKAKTGRGKK